VHRNSAKYEHPIIRSEFEALSGREVLLGGQVALVRNRWTVTPFDEAWSNWRSTLLGTDVLKQNTNSKALIRTRTNLELQFHHPVSLEHIVEDNKPMILSLILTLVTA